MLRRLCWATGVLGWGASVALAIPLSRMMFQSSTHAWALAILGGTLLLGAINGGQLALAARLAPDRRHRARADRRRRTEHDRDDLRFTHGCASAASFR
jgi:hypothetical protein